MRRATAATLVTMLAALALAACGSSGPAGTPNQAVSAAGAFGKAPVVKIPAEKASSKLTISTPIKGSGTVIPSSDDVLVNLALYDWSGKTHKLLQSTFTTAGSPQVLPANVGLPGLAQAVAGKKVGDRVLAVIPPKFGYGTQGNPNLNIKGTDTTVWVIDLIKAYSPTASATGTSVSSGGGTLPTVTSNPGAAPTVTIPKNSPSSALVTKTLIQGTGPVLTTGQTVVVQYVGVLYRTGKVFGTSWPSASNPSSLLTFQLGGQGLIKGFQAAVTGARVGSRVMAIVPPAEGYGSAGQPSAGITGKDTLVFVIDILDAVNGSAK
jgi:FKBP-type peptidyl-prolyl cis-trans isomerase